MSNSSNTQRTPGLDAHSEGRTLVMQPANRRVPPDVERCPCGYPMPCSKKVPITLCRAPIAKAGAQS